jgi:hypothetical protein
MPRIKTNNPTLRHLRDVEGYVNTDSEGYRQWEREREARKARRTVAPLPDKFKRPTGLSVPVQPEEEWDTKKKSRGLGDTIAKFTHATGIDVIADKIAQVRGKPCGCRKRQEVLNKFLAYKGEDKAGETK